jgi:hypothetical protein
MRISYNLNLHRRRQKWMLESEVDFSQQTTRWILSETERLLNASQGAAMVNRRVFRVMAESLQNIMRHTDLAGLKTCSQKALILLEETPYLYTVISQNAVSRTKVAALTNKLHFINALSKTALKDLYRNTIQSNVPVKNGGAGLGLLDMARKSGQKLTFDFRETFQGYYFFLKVRINREEN